jgi:mono/diheme cytochrome c family protein
MKRISAVVASIALGVVFSSTAYAAGTIAIGKSEFRNSCALCHGQSGKGDAGVLDLLKKGPPDLTLLTKNNGGKFPTERVAAMIDGRELVKGHGERDMPAWGDRYAKDKVKAAEYYGDFPYKDTEMFVQSRINALMEYLKSIQVK